MSIFEPISFDETKCKIRFIYVGFNCKTKSGIKNLREMCANKGGGDPMSNGKCHFKFPFFFFEPIPKDGVHLLLGPPP